MQTYEEYQKMMASYGFINCPISSNQHAKAREGGVTDDGMYGLGCDVNAGVDFHVAVKLNATYPDGWHVVTC